MYIKKFEEKVPGKVGECIYLIVKNARASRALRWALDPSQYYIACFPHPTPLRYVGKISEQISGPPLDQILDPLVTAHVRSMREGNVLTRICPSINLSVHRGGYPYPIMLCNISQNAMRQGGYPDPPRGGTQVRSPPGGVPGSGTPPWGGGYPGRTTEGVFTTRRAVCLLRSRRRTFL